MASSKDFERMENHFKKRTISLRKANGLKRTIFKRFRSIS